MAGALYVEANEPADCTIDEPGWVTSSLVTYRLFRSLAPPSRWGVAYDELQLGEWGNKNPPVGKLLVGAVVAAAAEPEERIAYHWTWPHGYEWNLRAGSLPPDRILLPPRRAIAVMGGLLLGLIYGCALLLTGRPWLSLLAPGLVWALPVFEFHATHVYMDVPQLLFLMAGQLGLLWHLKSQ
jgi:hypothetical protein